MGSSAPSTTCSPRLLRLSSLLRTTASSPSFLSPLCHRHDSPPTSGSEPALPISNPTSSSFSLCPLSSSLSSPLSVRSLSSKHVYALGERREERKERNPTPSVDERRGGVGSRRGLPEHWVDPPSTAARYLTKMRWRGKGKGSNGNRGDGARRRLGRKEKRGKRTLGALRKFRRVEGVLCSSYVLKEVAEGTRESSEAALRRK